MKWEASIDPIIIAQKVCASIYDGTTKELDTLSSEISISMGTIHPEYIKLAGYIVISDMHKNNNNNFEEITNKLYENNIVSKEYYNKFIEYKEYILKKLIIKKII